MTSFGIRVFRHLLLYLSIVFAPHLALAEQTARAASESSVAIGHALLWKIEGKGYAPSYLFGTIHIADPRVTKLAPPVRQAFDRAQRLVMEVRMDYGAYAEVLQGMFFNDGTTLQSLIGTKLYRRVVQVMAHNGWTPNMVAIMKPWAVMSTAGLAGFNTGVALDLQLYNQATLQRKPAYGLESAAEQIAVFDGMSKQAQIELVRSTVEHRDAAAAEAQSLLQAYLERDPDKLEQISRQEMRDTPPAFAAEFYQRVVTDRNRRMVQRLQAHLRAGNAFIAVGALHLPGDSGIVHLLQEQGYAVTPVY